MCDLIQKQNMLQTARFILIIFLKKIKIMSIPKNSQNRVCKINFFKMMPKH